jgi:hypothetical protein
MKNSGKNFIIKTLLNFIIYKQFFDTRHQSFLTERYFFGDMPIAFVNRLEK